MLSLLTLNGKELKCTAVIEYNADTPQFKENTDTWGLCNAADRSMNAQVCSVAGLSQNKVSTVLQTGEKMS